LENDESLKPEDTNCGNLSKKEDFRNLLFGGRLLPTLKLKITPVDFLI